MQRPFGEPDTESEVLGLSNSGYQQLFFSETPFNAAAIDPKCYLIIGRRGSGKTALCKYFTFQKLLPNTQAITIEQKEHFDQILERINSLPRLPRPRAVYRAALVWHCLIWSLIFAHFRDADPRIAAASLVDALTLTLAGQIKQILRHIFSVLGSV